MIESVHDAEVKTPTEARQGVTGHKVRYVLGVSLCLAVLAVGIALLVFVL
ncbi:MAG: hypothetical protein AB7G39_19745 [Alphaproteobacteria bacterium]